MKRLKENFNKGNILIIGAGVIGKFNAIELTELGYTVTIVDPADHKNSSNAALGLLMGNMYQKRNGRGWMLRKTSLELWPKWIRFLQKFNKKLNIEKPLIQLTTNELKFTKLEKFANENIHQGLEVLKKDSQIVENINKAFQISNLQGLISYKDGRIDPISLLETLDIYIKYKNINFLKDEIVNIKRSNNQWIAKASDNHEIKSDAIILCNSLNASNLLSNEILKVRLRPVLGQAIEVCIDEKEINLLSLPKHFNINGKNILPISKNKIIIGSTDEYSTQPEETVFEKLTDFLEIKPKWLRKEKISKKWFGVRSRPEGESAPILVSIDKRLILCTGFYKNGILLAPACADWVSNELKKHLI